LPRLEGKEILIVGGAGFLGYYLVQTLLFWNENIGETPIKITVFDSFIRGYPGWLKRLEKTAYLNIQTVDITKPLASDILSFHYIIHAASIASPTYYRKFPIETMDANVNGLRILLDHALKNSNTTEGFLYFSSSEIYGDPAPESIPTPEDYRGNVSCTGPRACYDESKRYGETLCVNFAQQYQLPIKIARPFNNYGPGLKITDRRVLPDFARDIFADRDIVLLSDGSPKRTFCYIADAIVGYFKVLISGKPGVPYNIGTAEPEISMRELARQSCAIAKSGFSYNGNVVAKESKDRAYLTDSPNRRCPGIRRAEKDLQYRPESTFADGLERALLWYSGNRDGSDA